VIKDVAVSFDNTIVLVDKVSGQLGFLSPDRTKTLEDTSGKLVAQVSVGVKTLGVVTVDGKAFFFTGTDTLL